MADATATVRKARYNARQEQGLECYTVVTHSQKVSAFLYDLNLIAENELENREAIARAIAAFLELEIYAHNNESPYANDPDE